MTKLHIMSDLHLEFDRGDEWAPTNENNADILLLAGDIQVGAHLYAWFSDRLRDYRHVLYIPGNHEFYRQNYHKLVYQGGFADFQNMVHEDARMRGYQGQLHTLINDSVIIDGITYFGSTLWTDMNKDDPMTHEVVNGGMNDFKLIKVVNEAKEYRRFSTRYAAQEHAIAVDFLTQGLNNTTTDKNVVMTHHSPTFATINPEYKNDKHMNGGYASELPDLIEQADLWVHGHIHAAFNAEVYDTRIVLNPRGYVNHETDTGFDPQLIVEV